MKNVHETTVHGRCPINSNWDYYTLMVTTEEFMLVDDIDEMCDFVRGKAMTQEEIADNLRATLPSHCKIELRGQHGQNFRTVTFR